jgi:hypothetical protein
MGGGRNRRTRGVRRGAGVSRHGPRARRRARDVPPRRVPGAAHVRELPGPRTVLRDLLGALAGSGNRFVLTTRYVARAHRLLRDAPSAIRADPRAAAHGGRSPCHAAARRPSPAASRRCRRRCRRPRARRTRAAGAGALGRPPAYARTSPRPSAHRSARRADPFSALTCAAGARRRARRRLPVLLRTAPAPRARLRRAEGHPRRARAGRAAHAHRDRAAAPPHARLDEGLPVVARRRGPHRVPAEAIQLRRSDAAPLGAAARLVRAAVRRGPRARGPRLRAGRLPEAEPALALAGAPPRRPRDRSGGSSRSTDRAASRCYASASMDAERLERLPRRGLRRFLLAACRPRARSRVPPISTSTSKRRRCAGPTSARGGTRQAAIVALQPLLQRRLVVLGERRRRARAAASSIRPANCRSMKPRAGSMPPSR